MTPQGEGTTGVGEAAAVGEAEEVGGAADNVGTPAAGDAATAEAGDGLDAFFALN